MQKQCRDELDLFLLKKNISGSAENTLRAFHEFFKSQKKDVDMTYFLKQPVMEPTKEIDETIEQQFEMLSSEDKALFKKSYYTQNRDIKISNFANLYLQSYAVFCQQTDQLMLEWKKLKKEVGSRFYKNREMLVEYDSKNRAFSLVKRPKGRPRVEESRKRISIRVDKDLFRLIEAYSKDNNLTQQEFLLKAITSIIKPEKVVADNPILDFMKQRYDIEGNIREMYGKIISKK